jgi:hypothetical protein
MHDPDHKVTKSATKSCHDFNADAELGRKSRIYDITGVVASFCRHGYCITAMNCFTGERYAYAMLVLYKIFILHQIEVSFFWYDINCRFRKTYSRWLALMDSQERDTSCAHATRFPLPVFHKYAHSAQCQMENNSSIMVGAGLSPGEPPEQRWSMLGHLGKTTQYMTGKNRQGRLERALQYLHARLNDTHPSLLVRMGARAKEKVRIIHGSFFVLFDYLLYICFLHLLNSFK